MTPDSVTPAGSQRPQRGKAALVSSGELRRYGLLRPLVRQRLIARAIAGLTLSEAESQEARSLFLRQNRLQDEDALEAWRLDQGLGLADLAWLIERPLRIQRFSLEQFRAQAEHRFLQRKSDLDRLVISLLQVDSRGLAQELYLKVNEAEAEFGDLASRYSQGPEKRRRGIVGPVSLRQLPPPVAQLLKGAEIGSLFPPVRVGPHWLVVRFESRQEASFDEATCRRMSRELFEAWLEAETSRLLRQAVAQADGGVRAGADT